MRRLILLLAISMVFLANTCRKDENCPADAHNGLTVKNESPVRIRFNFYWNHPDTAIGTYNTANDGSDGLSPGESLTRGAGPGSCWESVFMDNKKEWIYFFNADTIEQLDWNTVRQTNRGLLERREIDLNYLKSNNFTVIYK